ncbi:ATP-binding protein [Microbacterium sp.]|uniref:ATP-binding protein n=1 Tax=Microbacterium sp. TaxID=51671 RepID=UPI0039E6DA4B
MAALLPRHSASFAQEALRTFPAIVIQGARQVGKSTFAEQIVAAGARLITLDDATTRAVASESPEALIEQASDATLVIDELQRAPELLLAIKASIDRDRRPGRFVLTGSSNLLRLSRTPDSLAGRAITVGLRGFSQGEWASTPEDFVAKLVDGVDAGRVESGVDRAGYIERIARGGYPEAGRLTGRMRASWFDSYVERLLERDVADIAPRVDPGRIAVVLRLLAASQAGELVKARVARDADVPETSVSAYIDLLETMYLVERLRPWTPNLTSREAGKPKMIVNDPGLALRVGRISEQQLSALGSPHLGAAVEGFVVSELFKQRGWSREEYDLFHFRDRTGIEVDIIVELRDGSVIALEVKSGSTLKQEHFRGLKFLRDKLGDRFLGGYVLNTASTGTRFGDRLAALPISALWEL